MLSKDHLALELMRLRPTSEWEPKAAGLFFLFIKAGTGKCTVGQTKQNIGAGDMLVFDGSAGGKIGVAPGKELIFWWFSANLENFFPLFQGIEIAFLQNVIESLKGLKLYAASKPLAEKCHQLILGVPSQLDLDHRAQVLRVAASVLNAEFSAAQNQRVGFIGVEERLTGVLEKLTADELLTFSVDELAKRFGCSRRHLGRLFHSRFGFSVAGLRMEMRLIKAASLLRCHNLKIINLAEQCGFNHMGLFNTCFKRRFGTTPSQWRNEIAKANEKPMAEKKQEMDCPLRTNGLCPWTGTEKAAQAVRPLSVSSSNGVMARLQTNSPQGRPGNRSASKISDHRNFCADLEDSPSQL